MTTALEQLAHGQLDAFLQAIETAKAEVRQATVADKNRLEQTVAVLVDSCLHLVSVLQAHWESVLELMCHGLLTSERVTAIRRSRDTAMLILGAMSDLASRTEHVNIAFDRERLRLAETKADRVGKALDEHLQALAELERAECLPLDEAFAAIVGVTKAEWLKRVDDKKRA